MKYHIHHPSSRPPSSVFSSICTRFTLFAYANASTPNRRMVGKESDASMLFATYSTLTSERSDYSLTDKGCDTLVERIGTTITPGREDIMT